MPDYVPWEEGTGEGGTTIGRWAMIGAGSVLTRDVLDDGLVYGNPARLHGLLPTRREIGGSDQSIEEGFGVSAKGRNHARAYSELLGVQRAGWRTWMSREQRGSGQGGLRAG